MRLVPIGLRPHWAGRSTHNENIGATRSSCTHLCLYTMSVERMGAVGTGTLQRETLHATEYFKSNLCFRRISRGCRAALEASEDPFPRVP